MANQLLVQKKIAKRLSKNKNLMSIWEVKGRNMTGSFSLKRVKMTIKAAAVKTLKIQVKKIKMMVTLN